VNGKTQLKTFHYALSGIFPFSQQLNRRISESLTITGRCALGFFALMWSLLLPGALLDE
jgi:hypothetical protein